MSGAEGDVAFGVSMWVLRVSDAVVVVVMVGSGGIPFTRPCPLVLSSVGVSTLIGNAAVHWLT